ncbi:hypothetical protein IPA_08730 [Ignicoccus pacificus DSM 13166]|uniref:DUF3194 domain-containing protein n=1 Tax=Ignicoccus pacificus DSM 13166 TaxID=940294 RepID=A0A977KBY5_9CREN|nr:hypothetical protein IPA_08730 [Ignicoccus pacificus DSM 13166]
MVVEEDKLERIAEALLKASDKIEEVVEKELGRRVEDLDLTIVLSERGEGKEVTLELGISGLRGKKEYEEVVEEALREGEKELDRAFQKGSGSDEGSEG